MRRVLSLILALSATWVAAAPRPNVVLILADDLGYGDLGCYGNTTIKTPHLDRLAATGQRWTDFYASGSSCLPSRTGLMSGRHPHLLKGQLAADRDQLLPALLKQRGYATAIIGKWHLARYPKDFFNHPMHPLNCGFDYHYGTMGSNDVPPPPGKRQTRAVFDACDAFDFPVPLLRNHEVVESPANQALFTRRYTNEAVRWIESHREQPFFLYLSHNVPHVPIFPSDAFKGKSAGGTYGDVVEELDWSVGQLVACLKRLDLATNTLVIFSSDNGPWTMFGPHGGTTGPLRGEKGTSWEGGSRVPAIFNWPGTIDPAVIDELGVNLDLYQTLAQLTGEPHQPDLSAFISLDLSETLLRGAPSPRRSWLFHGGPIAFRSGPYKIQLRTKPYSSDPTTRKPLKLVTHNPPLLFDLSNDLGEQHNLANTHPELLQKLLTAHQRFLRETKK